MAESSLTRRVVARTTIEAEVRSPNARAPRNTLRPRRKAMTTPGKDGVGEGVPDEREPPQDHVRADRARDRPHQDRPRSGPAA